MSDYYTTEAREDIPPKSNWDDATPSTNVIEYKGFKIGIPNREFPYLLGIDTDIPDLSGTFTKLRQAEIAIDAYLT
jgi:hypothetical protein